MPTVDHLEFPHRAGGALSVGTEWCDEMETRMLVERAPALLVDDNPDALVVIAAFLVSAGFDVVQAHTGDEALEYLSSGREFALLVTDYAMPGMSGTDLATMALEQLPALKVLIISGFPSDAGLFQRPASVALLAKPFGRDKLIEVLKSLFDIERNALPALPDRTVTTDSGTST
jgi:CheY-like chemotaxis protein